jgi:hypothetical protein
MLCPKKGKELATHTDAKEYRCIADPNANATSPCHSSFDGEVAAPPDKFDFTPALDPNRTFDGNVITVGIWSFQHTTGAGHNFNIIFDGSWHVHADGQCPKKGIIPWHFSIGYHLL